MSSDSRKSDRYLHSSKVILKDSELGSSFRGELFNFSDEGFYFETDEFMSAGTDIYIGLLNSPYSRRSNTYDCRRISVKWCKRLIDSGYRYGYGAEQIQINRYVSEKVSMVKGGRQDKITRVDDNGVTVNRCEGIAAIGGAALDNEECYLYTKLMRSLGVVYLEHQARI